MNGPHPTRYEANELRQGVVDLNERNWLPRHCQGDQQAFNELLQSYRTLVFTFLCRYGIEAQYRDDLFQDICLKIHQSAARYRASEPLRPWLISIVLNTVRNFRRDLGRRRHFMTHLKAVPSESNPGLDQNLEHRATVSWLELRIASLPVRQREVLVLSTLKGMRLKEIASILELPENTVKTHLRRARLELAENLASRENRGLKPGGDKA
jgi:RNA polymerase sigma-70 factor (ECF subfamily)